MNSIALIVLAGKLAKPILTPPDTPKLPTPDPEQKAADPSQSTSGICV